MPEPPVITVREYHERDAAAVGRLIARTYSAFNLGFATAEERATLLGPFRFAGSADPAHRLAIAAALEAPIVLVAERGAAVVGVLRGGRLDRKGRTVLQSLFVDAGHHRRGIGRRLVTEFERRCPAGAVIVAASTLYAVPFYLALGYRRSTGVRTMRSFAGEGLPYQPVKKAPA